MSEQQEANCSRCSSIYESAANSLDTTHLEPGIYSPKNKLTCSQNDSRNKSKRFVFKNGEFNIDKTNSSQRSLISKWFIIMVEAQWRWTLIHFFMAFTADWLLFGFLYWVIALIHGDLFEDHLPNHQNITDWVPCVKNIYGFTSSFLFSVEVHTTVAYGKRSITLDCPQTITVMCFQCIISQILQALMVGILFAKFTRPKSRTQTILFSKQAVITLRDGKLCMIFRVGDMRKSRILNIKASMYILHSDNGDLNHFEQTEMNVEMDGCESTFFMWPVSVIHNIDEKSPLYKISAAEMLLNKIEILAVFEGIIESTGQPVQARTSYTESDIFWGRRFMPMVSCKTNMYEVDYSKLCETERFDAPLCSANEFHSMMSVFQTDCDSF